MKFRTLLESSILMALAPATVFAQDAAPPATDAAPEGNLEEIVVTAQFRVENVQKAALAIDVVGSDELARAGITSPTQLTTMVPALQISQGGVGTQSLFIRGVGTLTSNSYTDPGVAFNVDGIYIGRPTSMRNIFFDLHRVEVLKGPQGTLYGRNATGGAINVLPNQPLLGTAEGYVRATYGDYDTQRIEAAANLPFGDTVAARLAATMNRNDGYLSDGTNDSDSYAVRGQVLFEPSDGLSLRLGADFAHDDGNGAGSTITAYLNPFTLQAVRDPVDRGLGLKHPRVGEIFQGQYSFMSGRFGQPVTDETFVDNDYFGLKGELSAETGAGTLTVLAAYRESDLSGLDLGVGFPAYTNQDDDQTSFEARLAGPDDGRFRWLVGAYYYDENIESDYQFNLYSLTSLQDLSTGTTSMAGFARVTLAPTDELRFVAGLRYTDEEKRFDGQSSIFLDICTAAIPPIPACPAAPFFPFAATPEDLIATMGLIQVAPGPAPVYIQPTPEAANTIFQRVNIPVDDSLNEGRTTFRLAVEYDVAPDSLLYASFENGFHAGGFAFAQIAPTFEPEEIDAWTIGSKNRFLDSRLQVNLEAFLWKYKDQQVSHFATDLSGALVFVTENAGRSTNQGFELSVDFRPTLSTTLRLDAQYLHARYDEFTYLLPTAPAPPISGCPMTPAGPTLVSVDCSDREALRSPEWTFNAGIQQVIPAGAHEFVVSLDTHYQSDSVIGYEMLPEISTQEAYFMTNLSADFGPADGQWMIGAFVNNIEDERPIGQSYFNNQFDTFASSPLPPRTYGVRAEYHW